MNPVLKVLLAEAQRSENYFIIAGIIAESISMPLPPDVNPTMARIAYWMYPVGRVLSRLAKFFIPKLEAALTTKESPDA